MAYGTSVTTKSLMKRSCEDKIACKCDVINVLHRSYSNE
jgi:hypothetical protein